MTSNLKLNCAKCYVCKTISESPRLTMFDSEVVGKATICSDKCLDKFIKFERTRTLEHKEVKEFKIENDLHVEDL